MPNYLSLRRAKIKPKIFDILGNPSYTSVITRLSEWLQLIVRVIWMRSAKLNVLKLNELRKSKGLRKKNVAAATGLSSTTITQAFKRGLAGWSALEKIAEVLGVSVNDILLSAAETSGPGAVSDRDKKGGCWGNVIMDDTDQSQQGSDE
jgi:transcriptional regulator with XRE-family HTH domain